MNHHQTTREIARRLPHLRRRDIEEVLQVLSELWRSELLKANGEVQVTGLGKLYIECHTLRVTGIIRQRLHKKYGEIAPQYVTRRVIRFRTFKAFRAALQTDPGAQP